MLRIEIGEQLVVDGQRRYRAGAGGAKAQHTVGAVGVVVDQLLVGIDAAGAFVGGDAQALQRICRYRRMPRADLVPRQLAVAVLIETDGKIQVAQRNVPLAGDALTLHLQRQIAVAGLVRIGRQRRAAQQRKK